jgi:para-nitrobenzyl esterase
MIWLTPSVEILIPPREWRSVLNIVETEKGYVSGTALDEAEQRIHAYRGIPYASPPIGDLRWKPPQPPSAWSGVRECTAFSAAAPETSFGLPSMLHGLSQSEDCLYLNVLTPAENAREKLPVMFWLHGGGLEMWSGNHRIYNGLRLPAKGVVLVNVNTRLGPLGLFAHPLLSRESPERVSGNYLFLDIIAALKWVQQNIASFGGDPANVTIFGESGGCAKALCLMASPLAKGLFHKAICESGSARRGKPLDDMEAIGARVFAILGVDREKDPLSAARALPWEEIIKCSIALKTNPILPGPWDAAIDGWFLLDTPANIFKAGNQNIVPFVVGGNMGELTGPGVIVLPHIIPDFVNVLKGASKAGGKAYAYIFDRVPEGWKKDGAVCAHTMELPYVFGDWDNNSDFWEAVFYITKPSGARTAYPGFSEKDTKVSETMMMLWTSFAKTGNPGQDGLLDWPVYDEFTDRYLYITESLQVKSGFSRLI